MVGIIFITRNFTIDKSYKSFSHDSTCPNTNYGFRGEQACDKEWTSSKNPFLEYALTDWPFPIFYVKNKTLIDSLLNCEEKFKTTNHLCNIELKSFMFGNINTKRCLNRNRHFLETVVFKSFCSNIMVHNIFSPLIPLKTNFTLEDRSILVLTARLDSFTMFDTFSPGLSQTYFA